MVEDEDSIRRNIKTFCTICGKQIIGSIEGHFYLRS